MRGALPWIAALAWLVASGAAVAAAQAGAQAPPSFVGTEAQVIFVAFLVVLLVVPWLMAREAPGEDPTVRAAGPGEAAPTSRFSSGRERRLWLWTVVVLVAIYSTLGPVGEVAAALRERNLLGLTSAVIFVVVVGLVAVPWARRRPGRAEIGAALAVLAVYVAALARIPVPESRSHLVEYGLVAVLVYHALAERRRNGRSVPSPAFVALVATVLLGWIDEAIQAFLPNRSYDLVDVGFNAVAALMAITASSVMGRARRLDLSGDSVAPSPS